MASLPASPSLCPVGRPAAANRWRLSCASGCLSVLAVLLACLLLAPLLAPALAGAVTFAPGSIDAPAAPASEYEQKARVVATMARLAKWSGDTLGSAATPFQLCLLGKDPFGNAWAPYEQGTVHGRPFRTRRIAALEELEGCAVVFIAKSEATRLHRYLQVLANLPVLTVSEIDGFVEAGGHLELLMTDGRVEFNLNLERGFPNANPYLPTSIIPARNLVRLRK